MIELSETTETLARRLAVAQDLTIDETIRRALEAREAIVQSVALPRDAIAARRAAIERAVRAIAALPELDGRSSEEIMDDLNPL